MEFHELKSDTGYATIEIKSEDLNKLVIPDDLPKNLRLRIYANIENIAVNEGDYVLQNTKIGEVGKSNNTSNDYVFKFLIFKDETTLNPRYWLK